VRPRRILCSLLAGSALGALLAAPAAADLSFRERVTGGLTITWAGDPARGCADAGLCDVRGSVTVRGNGSGNSSTSSSGDDEETAMHSLYLDATSGVARVVRGPPEAPLGTCTDLVPGGFELEADRVRGGSAQIMLVPLGVPAAVPLGGRCAGPLASDLVEAGLLTTTVRRSRLVSGFARIDLSGTRSFTSGPFSGELRSDLVIERTSRRVGGAGEESRDDRPFPESRRMALVELRYAVETAGGSLATSWRGGEEPFCLALDACGLSGTHELTAPATRGTLQMFGIVRASRLRPGESAISAIRSGRVRPDGIGVELRRPARVEATASRGGPVCRDSTRVPLAVAGEIRRGALRLELARVDESEPDEDPLRTRCPGPASADLPGRTPAGAVIPLRRLGARRLDVVLRPPRGAAPGPFSLARAGGIPLRLRLRRARLDGTP
jgi:hypothetical protein